MVRRERLRHRGGHQILFLIYPQIMVLVKLPNYLVVREFYYFRRVLPMLNLGLLGHLEGELKDTVLHELYSCYLARSNQLKIE